MTCSLSVLRIRFEQALLSWLRSDITSPCTNEKYQILQILHDCIMQLQREIEPYEFYWQYAQAVFYDLLEYQLADQIIYRKLAAKINLLIGQKIQQIQYRASKELWRETLILSNRKTKLTALTDSFLRDAEDCLQQLDLSNVDRQIMALEIMLSPAKKMYALAIGAGFNLLVMLTKALENLLTILQQVSVSSMSEDEYFALEITQKSMRSLLHQAAAGISPKQDDLFIDALFACGQVTSVRLMNTQK